jgi:hypothetical protein
LQGIEGGQVLNSIVEILNCDDYTRQAPGWSYNDPSRRSIELIELKPMCEANIQSLRINEEDVSENGEFEYIYMTSGDRLMLLYLASSDSVEADADGLACAIAEQFFSA